ncbi:MAG: uroporphyrinogen-III C-methyltransferase [Synergistaceae bacterium]|jgi:uroporphyrinogen III methyltransferase/synthase|nr:uroporphyrinogen-III C-methyltransferase [Synergistaceae bacterium]
MSVWLVGAGCGSPGLLAMAASERVSRARHIVYDRLIHPDILQLAPRECRFYLVGKQEGNHTMSQDGINELLVRLGRTGDDVVRLKGGDPFVFGRGGEEAEFLEKNGVPWQAIPGITSSLGGAVSAGLPVTQRGLSSSMALATGHRGCGCGDSEDQWRELAAFSGTVALYMGSSNFAEVASRLVSHGKPPQTPVSAVQWGGWARAMRICGTLESMGEAARRGELPSPSVIYIGDAAGMALSPEKGPLGGMQVAICRPYPECWKAGRAIEWLSADCYGVPLLSCEPVRVEAADLEAIAAADWLVLSSPRGIGALKSASLDLRRIRGRIVSIGDGTAAALLDAGIAPEHTAGGDSGHLASLLERLVSPGDSVVFARNERGSDAALHAAVKSGADARVVPIYRMVPSDVPGLDVMKEQWEVCGVGAVAFGSSAMAEEYARRLGEPPASAALVAWGARCAETVRDIFGREAIIMRTPDIDGLAGALKLIAKG